MKRFFSIVFFAIFLFPQIASSEENRDYYISATGGYLFTNDADLPDQKTQDGVNPDFTYYNIHNDVFDSEATFDTGSSATIAFGKSWGRFFRTEFEYGYRNAGFRSVEGTLESYLIQDYVGGDDANKIAEKLIENALILKEGGALLPFEESTSGNISFHSLMANAFLDYSNKTRLTPYVGAGVGLAIWKYNYVIDGFNDQNVITGRFDVPGDTTYHPNPRNETQSNEFSRQTNNLLPVGYLHGEEKGVDFAYQLMAGIAFDFTDNIKGTAGYRLFGIENDLGFIAHSTEMGIRYSF